VEIQPVRKSAGLAFLISLLVPGAGQMYCGKIARGGTTLAFFVLSVVLTRDGPRSSFSD
jgi:TM2 domain-containing membrane protein YozV